MWYNATGWCACTYCAAVLTENRFMDSEVSLAPLESDERRRAIVALHVKGLRSMGRAYSSD